MRIMTREELAAMPAGTVFMKYPRINGDIHIKMGNLKGKYYHCNEDTWHAELLLAPFGQEIDDKNCALQWYTTDITKYDYDKTQKFGVFSKLEVQQMINCLTWALADCEPNFYTQDLWFINDTVLTDKEFYEDYGD